jgi:hypothetical protein
MHSLLSGYTLYKFTPYKNLENEEPFAEFCYGISSVD